MGLKALIVTISALGFKRAGSGIMSENASTFLIFLFFILIIITETVFFLLQMTFHK